MLNKNKVHAILTSSNEQARAKAIAEIRQWESRNGPLCDHLEPLVRAMRGSDYGLTRIVGLLAEIGIRHVCIESIASTLTEERE